MRYPKNTYDAKRGIWQPKISEESVLKEIVFRLWSQAKIKVWRVAERIPVKGKRWQRLSTPGIPDLVGWVPAYTNPSLRNALPLFIEVKRPGGARRPAQERFIEEAKADGCCAFFAEGWEDCVRELAEFGIEFKLQ